MKIGWSIVVSAVASRCSRSRARRSSSSRSSASRARASGTASAHSSGSVSATLAGATSRRLGSSVGRPSGATSFTPLAPAGRCPWNTSSVPLVATYSMCPSRARATPIALPMEGTKRSRTRKRSVAPSASVTACNVTRASSAAPSARWRWKSWRANSRAVSTAVPAWRAIMVRRSRSCTPNASRIAPSSRMTPVLRWPKRTAAHSSIVLRATSGPGARCDASRGTPVCAVDTASCASAIATGSVEITRPASTCNTRSKPLVPIARTSMTSQGITRCTASAIA